MKRFLCLMLVLSSITIYGQRSFKILSFKQNVKDISARTHQRETPSGDVCALVKVQMPFRDVIFDGDIIGEIAYKINEYWIYMPQHSTYIDIKLPGFTPCTIDFKSYGISFLESKGTYELCIIEDKGDAPDLYKEGIRALISNDVIAAFDMLEEASEMGYTSATYVLGNALIEKINSYEADDYITEEEYQQAYYYLKSAAERNSADAQFALAKLMLEYRKKREYEYETLSKIVVDSTFLADSTIWNLLEKAANAGVIKAQFFLISNDTWCEENAAKGNAIAEFGMGLRFDKEGVRGLDFRKFEIMEPQVHYEDSVNAFQWYQKAANHGLDIAQWKLANFYAKGIVVNEDVDSAIFWRTKAAEQGHYVFQYMMAVMYAWGIFADLDEFYNWGTELSLRAWHEFDPNIEKANFWLRKFNHKELSREDWDHIEGNGVFTMTLDTLCGAFIANGNYEEAIYWYQRQIEKGYPEPCIRLGEMYYRGLGVVQDYEKARLLFEKAASKDFHRYHHNDYPGLDKAEYYLGIIYLYGKGVPQDMEKAKTYFMESIANGFRNSAAHYELGVLYEQEGDMEKAQKHFDEAEQK